MALDIEDMEEVVMDVELVEDPDDEDVRGFRIVIYDDESRYAGPIRNVAARALTDGRMFQDLMTAFGFRVKPGEELSRQLMERFRT